MMSLLQKHLGGARSAPSHPSGAHPSDEEDRSLLQSALGQCRGLLGYTLLFSACLNLLFIAPTLYMLQVYDRVVPTQGRSTLALITLVLVGALVALSLLDWTRTRLLVRMGARLERLLGQAILRAGISSSAAPGSAPKAGVRDFDSLRNALSGPAISALCDAPWTPVYVLICFIIHPWVGVLASVGILLILALAWYNDRSTQPALSKAATAASRSYESYQSTAAAAPTVVALGMLGPRVALHLDEREEMVRLQTETGLRSGGLAALSKFIRILLQSLALGIGALLAINNQISAGAIFASMFMVGRALAPIDQLLGSWRTIVQARRSFASLSDLLSLSTTAEARTHLPAPTGALSVSGAGVEDPVQGRVSLMSVSFALEPGEAMAVLGSSGAGKSTLLQVIAGARPPSTGEVRFDGAEQRDWNAEQLARHIGFMAQEPTLFAGTIRENIARFDPRCASGDEAHDAAVIAAAMKAGAHDMIVRLPGGYDYRLGWGGRGLSAGQAQQVSFARALYGSPTYLILDEPNAHLDTRAEARLNATLQELKAEGVTILFAVHKLNLLGIADKVLVLDGGSVREFGSRDQVLKQIATPARVVSQKVSAA